MTSILFATMTGNARECAEKAAASLASAGIPARTCDLATYTPNDLLAEKTVLLIISTWGEGEPPDDAVAFHDFVKSLEAPALENLRFAVFSLGDTSYEYFCQCGRDFDRLFEELGATRLLDRVDTDVGYYDAIEEWANGLPAAVGQPAANPTPAG